MQGLVQAMQTQAHTQAALQAQRSVSAGGRDAAVFGGEEGFLEEACSSFPEAGEEEGGFSVTAASRGIGKQPVSIGSRIAPDYSREVSVERHQPQQQQ
ncbi:hypothetical protein Taro_045121 [Colocasia esculenta]|uniref:Uncharacterized protein n=1 Tax=Colocasia esculenta TaxID=4460 RepID=A0A843X3R4_COLES|nr:hypothetical protein [Colocasia esculenta]